MSGCVYNWPPHLVFPVPDARIVRFGHSKALIVQRFDREIDVLKKLLNVCHWKICVKRWEWVQILNMK